MELDLTKADTARMIDYWLGGSHNFEVDRIAAEKVAALTPSAPNWVRAQRTFLQQAVRYIAEVGGIDCFLVAGAGLPTCGNVHEVMPQARVIYTDINPVTIAYGRNIIGDNPNVRYVHCDATKLYELDPGLLRETFGDGKPIGIVFIGLAYFLPDLVLSQSLSRMYEWAVPGSYLAISMIGREAEQFAADSVAIYAKMGNPLFPRAPGELMNLLRPWQPVPPGVAPATYWGNGHVVDTREPTFVYGCICLKAVTA